MTSPSPQILYVITDLELGGVPLHLSRLAPALMERGFRVTVVSLGPIGPVGPMLVQHGVDVRSCDGCCGLDFRVISRLGENIDELNPSVIHSFLFHANQAVRCAALLGGFPAHRIVCEIQTAEVERTWHLFVDRFTHPLCRLTIGNSPSVIDHLHQHAGIPLHRLRLVRGGIDLERIETAAPAGRSSLGLKDGGRVLIWVGRLDPVKGLEFLLRALADVSQALDVRLLLVGDGPERRRLEALSQQLGLRDVVQFLGLRTDVPSLLKAADIFVFPSRTEGLPNALLEAMAAGLPIVTTDVPGCRDLVTHRETGLLVPYGDAAALAAAIREVLEHREFAQDLGKKAQQNVVVHWRIQQTWREYEAIYREIAAENAREFSMFPSHFC